MGGGTLKYTVHNILVSKQLQKLLVKVETASKVSALTGNIFKEAVFHVSLQCKGGFDSDVVDL